MSVQEQSSKPWRWLPERRFDADFPLAFWFAGLWMYLKSFLYLCNVYSMGLEPPPYPTLVIAEAIYFGVTIIPAFLIGLALWNDKKWVVAWAIAFLLIDTPVLLFHVMRMDAAGFLDSGLTKILEFGALGLNVVSVAWLLGYRTVDKSSRPKARNANGPKR
jgi:hypothetical protein